MPAPGVQGWPGPLSTPDDPKPGIVLITSQSFTDKSSVSVNNCFSSAFDTYELHTSLTGSTTVVDLTMRLRAFGSDNSTASSYKFSGSQLGTTTALLNSAAAAQWQPIGYVISTGPAFTRVTLTGPALPTVTHATVHGSRYNDFTVVGSMWHTVTSAFDGFTLSPSSGTVSGFLSVYGYRKA